jgi:hypothetical protein
MTFQFTLFGSPMIANYHGIEFLEPDPHATKIDVQGTNGRWYSVNLDAESCACSTPQQPCAHLDRAVDMLRSRGRKAKSPAISSFHKAIRRSDIETSLYWAWWLVRFRGGSYIKNYCRGILLEETRNLDLWQQFTDGSAGKHWSAWVLKLAASRKAYAVECRAGNLTNADLKARITAEKRRGQPVSPDEIRALAQCSSLDDQLTAFYLTLEMDAASKKPCRAALLDTLSNCTSPPTTSDAWKRLVQLMPRQDYGPLFAVEVLHGFWDERCNEFANWTPATIDVARCRRVPVDAHDFHTSIGRARMKKSWSLIGPGKPLPNELDLRWAGGMMGLTWRHLALAQHGEDYRNVAWEAVQWPEWIWRTVSEWERSHLFGPRF